MRIVDLLSGHIVKREKGLDGERSGNKRPKWGGGSETKSELKVFLGLIEPLKKVLYV